jgi:hypothetical protein
MQPGYTFKRPLLILPAQGDSRDSNEIYKLFRNKPTPLLVVPCPEQPKQKDKGFCTSVMTGPS